MGYRRPRHSRFSQVQTFNGRDGRPKLASGLHGDWPTPKPGGYMSGSMPCVPDFQDHAGSPGDSRCPAHRSRGIIDWCPGQDAEEGI